MLHGAAFTLQGFVQGQLFRRVERAGAGLEQPLALRPVASQHPRRPLHNKQSGSRLIDQQDTAHGIHGDQPFPHAVDRQVERGVGEMAARQFGFEVALALRKRIGHQVKTIGNAGKFSAGPGTAGRNPHIELAIFQLARCRKNRRRGLDDGASAEHPGDPAAKKSHQRQRQEVQRQLPAGRCEHLVPVDADRYKKRRI